VNRNTRGRGRVWVVAAVAGLLAWMTPSACAHVLQYLAWFRVQRDLTITASELRFVYECRFDRAAYKPADPLMDTDGDSTASQHEIANFCLEAAQYLAADLLVMAAGQRRDVREESFYLFEDGSGFRCVLVAPLGDVKPGRYRLDFLDPAFASVGGSRLEDGQTTTGWVRSADPTVRLVSGDGRTLASCELGADAQTTLMFELGKLDAQTTQPPGDQAGEAVTRRNRPRAVHGVVSLDDSHDTALNARSQSVIINSTTGCRYPNSEPITF
jgi:hypothetical protein